MKIRKYWCNAMSTYNQKYAECPEIDKLEDVSKGRKSSITNK